MSIIPRSKFGNCEQCGATDVNCVKVKKELVCIHCNNNAKRKQYIDRANLKDKSRVLIDCEGISDRQSLINDLDAIFSRYIRIRESDPSGNVECFTCGKKSHWKEMQCGHYIKRGDTLLRWDSRNAKVQCPKCNCNDYGNMDEYTKRLNEEQPGLPEQLREESREVNKFTREDLKELLISLRDKLKIVELRFK